MNIAFDARYLSMVISHKANPEMLMGIGSYSYHLIKRLSEDYIMVGMKIATEI